MQKAVCDKGRKPHMAMHKAPDNYGIKLDMNIA
jgi:hypothetical protein